MWDAGCLCESQRVHCRDVNRALGHAPQRLRDRALDRSAGFSKRYLRQFVSDIRFDGKRVVMRVKGRFA
jgi:hypothetical protein